MLTCSILIHPHIAVYHLHSQLTLILLLSVVITTAITTTITHFLILYQSLAIRYLISLSLMFIQSETNFDCSLLAAEGQYV